MTWRATLLCLPSLSDEFQAVPASEARVRRSRAGAAVQECVRLGRPRFHPDAGRSDEPEPRQLQRPVRVQLPWTGSAGGHLSVSAEQSVLSLHRLYTVKGYKVETDTQVRFSRSQEVGGCGLPSDRSRMGGLRCLHGSQREGGVFLTSREGVLLPARSTQGGDGEPKSVCVKAGRRSSNHPGGVTCFVSRPLFRFTNTASGK